MCLWLFLYLINSAVCVSVLGKEFTQGCVVCLRAPSDEELPVFGLVEYILVPDDLKYLVVRQYSTDYYCQHLNAYCVNKASIFSLISVSDLSIHDIFHVYSFKSESYVVVRSCHHVDLFI